MTGTVNQRIKFSGKIGGVRRVFEGNVGTLVGGFNFNLEDLPTAGVLPAGTPVACDESTRTIVPLLTFSVAEASSSTKVKLTKGMEGTRVKVGMSLAVAGSLTEAATNAQKVVSIDTSNDEYDVVTLDAALTGTTKGAVLMEVTSVKKAKCVPNALLPYDVCLDRDAAAADGDGAWYSDKPVLENRIPPLTAEIKTALKENECYFRFSKRK